MKKIRYDVIIFLVNAVSMILELVASRVLSPYFGSSNLVWTAVIGIILLSSSIGNYYGGIIADKKNTNQNVKLILLISSIFVLLIPIIQEKVIGLIIGVTSNIKIGAIITTIFLFFVPSLFMGLLTPIILKLKLEDIENAGKISGKFYAIVTVGGIFGTFLGGFWLIPNFGSIYILFVLAIVLAILMLFVDFELDKKILSIVILITVICAFGMYFYKNNNNGGGENVLSNLTGNKVSYDTEYGRVIIYNAIRNNELVRILNIDSGYESATYVDEDKCNELVFSYTKYYDLMFKANENIKNTLLIGGAGYSYPKYYISNYEDKNMDVVEIDGKITEIAKEYFYLDKLIKDYNLEENKRLNLITEDGRTYLNQNQKKYDAILNDAFSGDSPAKTLTTLEAVQNIKKSLNENGLYLTNIISSLEGKNNKFLNAELNTLKQVFKNVYVIPCMENVDNLETVINNMVISTDLDLDFENKYNFENDNKIILTDDYCPVESLIPQK